MGVINEILSFYAAYRPAVLAVCAFVAFVVGFIAEYRRR